jgi:tRNA dimethylallyltransferase
VLAGPDPNSPAKGGRAPVVALLGPTAAGKSRIAFEVASASSSVELVSVDSMAVYRGMDIGTAKATGHERALVPYHLLDLVEPSEEYTVQQFQAEADRALAGIAARNHAALLVGGTGLYLRAVTDGLSFPGRYPDIAGSLADGLDASGPQGSGPRRSALEAMHRRLALLDPVAAGRVEPSNQRRLVRAMEVTLGSGRPFSSFGPGLDRFPPTAVAMVGISHQPAALDERIAARFARLMDLGFLEEVRSLAARPGGLSRTARQALGYRELLVHLEGGLTLHRAVDAAVRRTRSLARRQMAWFRRDPRIVWLDPDDDQVASITALCDGDPPHGVAVGDWHTTQ